MLVAILAASALARGDPVVALGIAGRLNVSAAAGAMATFAAASAVGDFYRAALCGKWGPWMARAGVSSGGAGQALAASPRRWRLARAAAFTASGALLEEILFRGFLQRWLAGIAGPALAVAVQATVFGLVHALPMAAAGAPRPLVAYCMLMPTAIGAALGALARYGLAYAWLVHWGLNYRAAVRSARITAAPDEALGGALGES